MAHRYTKRIQMDLKKFIESPPHGIFIECDEADILHIHALIIGPKDTPYEDGLFYFDYRMPPTYPIVPPQVKLMTTAHGQVRFNPNLYACGKVCLSILGTWSGPSWSSILSLSTVLISIQSLMCDDPYYNEPGREGSNRKEISDSYNIKTQYHTLKHAVGDMLEKRTFLPANLFKVAKEYFLKNFNNYMALCDRNAKYDGSTADDGFNGRVKVNFTEEMERLIKIKSSFE